MEAKRTTADERRVDPSEWPAAIGEIPRAQIVVGGPGTGKTEFLVRRCLHLIEHLDTDPDQILILSFGRRGVADLRQRIRNGLLGSVSQIDVATFHAFAARVLEVMAHRRGWLTPPEVLTGPEQVALVQELLRSEDPTRWSVAFRGLLSSPTFAREVTDFILRTREQLLTGEDLARLADERDDWRGLERFVNRYDMRLRELGRTDYGTLLAEAVWALEASGSVASPLHIAHVLVDEYQDTTHAQSRLLRAVCADGASLTVAADPYQSIYSFRGAALTNVSQFPIDFASGDDPAQRLVLTTSFRTPDSILDAAVRVTSGELPGAAGPVIAAPGSGRVDVHQFDQETEEAEWIASEVQRLHLEEGVAYRAIGVFVRSKRRFLPELSRALERRAIPHDTPDSRLADHPAVRFVLDAVVAATATGGAEETVRAIRRLLLGAVYRAQLGMVRSLEREALSAGGDWASVLIRTDRFAALGRLLGDPSWAASKPAEDGFWDVWSRLPELAGVVSDPTRGDERAAWSSLAQVLGRWNERNPRATLDDYRRLSEEEDFEAQPLLSYRPPEEDRLLLTTLHQSKGLECEVVFIADAVEGVFPDLRTRDSLLGVRHLLPHLPADTAAYRAFRLQEERRLAYTAMTRARRRVVWTATATGFEEGRGIPSRFLALVAGTATVAEAVSRPAPRHDPVTPREAEADLRRRLTDPGLGAPERLAALAVLVDTVGGVLRSPDAFAGVREAGPDTGLVPDDVQLSPSQAEAYDKCPRSYAIERWLKVGDESSVYAEFGTLIHRVLELNESEAHARGEAHGTLQRARELLAEEFDPATFGGAPYADAWLERGFSGLDRLYSKWPSPGAIADLERFVTLEIAGVEWRGYVDRIEVGSLGLKVVDYKTSKNPPTKAEVAASLQLGFYLLALADDPGMAALGSPRAAEMWFPLNQARSVTRREFDMANLDGVRDRLAEVSRQIRAEDWTPTPHDRCDRCRVRQLCPAWPQGNEAFVT